MSDGTKRFRWTVGRNLFAALFFAGGVGHFVAPEVYLRIMPPYLPYPRALVLISGLAELILGLLLLMRRTRPIAAWGLIALLVAVFPANLFMWRHADSFQIPSIVLLLRLPMQGLLIAWAWFYTRPESSRVAASQSIRPKTSAALVAFVMATLFHGCGFGGASLARLDRGMLVSAKSTTNEPIPVYFAANEETIEPGTVVKVISDDEGTGNQPDRKVVVGFQGGPHQGLAALMRRRDLQPGTR